MTPFSMVIKALIQKHGGNKSKIALKLGLKPNGKPIWPSQLLGQYEHGESQAKPPFYKAWKIAFGEDIERIIEGKDSIDTEEPTSFQHQIFEGDYVGLHKKAWNLFEDAMRSDKQLLKDLAATLKNLTHSGGNQ